MEAIDLSQLSADGDVLKMDDGRMLRLKIEVDQDANVQDEEFWGEFAWV